MRTGNGETDAVKADLALDVHGYVVKPVAAGKLIQTIDKVLRRPLGLKDAEFFRSIKIPKPIDNLADDGKASKTWTVLSRTSPFRTNEAIKEKHALFKEEHTTQDGAEEIKIINRRECAVDELLEGQILAQDIEAEVGSILLRRGTHLSKGMIARLRELATAIEPEQTIWVGELAAD